MNIFLQKYKIRLVVFAVSDVENKVHNIDEVIDYFFDSINNKEW